MPHHLPPDQADGEIDAGRQPFHGHAGVPLLIRKAFGERGSKADEISGICKILNNPFVIVFSKA